MNENDICRMKTISSNFAHLFTFALHAIFVHSLSFRSILIFDTIAYSIADYCLEKEILFVNRFTHSVQHIHQNSFYHNHITIKCREIVLVFFFNLIFFCSVFLLFAQFSTTNDENRGIFGAYSDGFV